MPGVCGCGAEMKQVRQSHPWRQEPRANGGKRGKLRSRSGGDLAWAGRQAMVGAAQPAFSLPSAPALNHVLLVLSYRRGN